MERQQKAYKGVIDYFKKKILDGELRPGEKLPPERDIAERLNVSRNSVREAIRIMDMTGVISSQQGSGNYITCEFQKSLAETMTMMFAMDQIDYRQISQIRQALECLAFSLAIENATDGQIEEMEKAVKELDRSQDDVKNAALDKKLHFQHRLCVQGMCLISLSWSRKNVWVGIRRHRLVRRICMINVMWL